MVILTWSREIEELLEDSALSNPESPSLAFLRREKFHISPLFSTSEDFQCSLTVVYAPFSGHRIHKPLPDTCWQLKLMCLRLVSKTVCAVWVFSIADFWSFRLRIVFWCCPCCVPPRPPRRFRLGLGRSHSRPLLTIPAYVNLKSQNLPESLSRVWA